MPFVFIVKMQQNQAELQVDTFTFKRVRISIQNGNFTAVITKQNNKGFTQDGVLFSSPEHCVLTLD